PEVCEITKNMLRYGPPGIAEGGCAAITGALERRVVEGGGALLLRHDVAAIEHLAGAVTGVRVRDKRTGAETLLRAPLVISDIGPGATHRLISVPAPEVVGASSGSLPLIPASDHTSGVPDDATTYAEFVAPLPPGPDTAIIPIPREARGLKVH